MHCNNLSCGPLHTHHKQVLIATHAVTVVVVMNGDVVFSLTTKRTANLLLFGKIASVSCSLLNWDFLTECAIT